MSKKVKRQPLRVFPSREEVLHVFDRRAKGIPMYKIAEEMNFGPSVVKGILERDRCLEVAIPENLYERAMEVHLHKKIKHGRKDPANRKQLPINPSTRPFSIPMHASPMQLEGLQKMNDSVLAEKSGELIKDYVSAYADLTKAEYHMGQIKRRCTQMLGSGGIELMELWLERLEEHYTKELVDFDD